jgi:hypothetical protein
METSNCYLNENKKDFIIRTIEEGAIETGHSISQSQTGI